MTVTSFSGTHPYRPQCLLANVDATPDVDADPDELADPDRLVAVVVAITSCIGQGKCWRCDDPLPTPPVLPAGSRATRCRCVPVCLPCGEHEAILEERGDEFAWHVDRHQRDAEIAASRGQCKSAILSGDVIVTEDGAAPVRSRPHPGGWAEFGYDDASDRSERQR